MHDFNNQKKMIKNIWIKIEVEEEIERRVDSIYKVSNKFPRKKGKNFVFGIIFPTFFLK